MMPRANSTQQTGLTLIEVLVALAIIAFGMTAAIKAVSTTIRGVQHLQDKTMALWVGEQILNEARVGMLAVGSRESLQQDTVLLGRHWLWVLTQQATPNPRINMIQISVYANDDDKALDHPTIQLSSYLYTVMKNENVAQ